MMVCIFAHVRTNQLIGENRQMLMATRTRRWTRADLARLPDDGNRYEIVCGALFVTPAPSVRHQQLVYVLVELLRDFVAMMQLGEVHQAPSAVVFEGSEVQPDVIVRRAIQSLPETWDQMPTPILAVEITSSSTRLRDLGAKRELYRDAGIDEYWIVDGDARTIRRVGIGLDEIVTDCIEWSPIGSKEPLLIDVVELFRRALG